MRPYLVKAKAELPLKTAPFLCKSDLQRINTGFGIIWYQSSLKNRVNMIDRYADLTTSLYYFKAAEQGNPFDISAVRGLAQTTSELEFLFPKLFPERQNPYNASPLFKKSLKIEPNGLDTNYAAANYYHKKGLKELFDKQLETAAKIYPSLGMLKKQPFYWAANKDAVIKGFKKAITEDIMPGAAHFSLSSIYSEKKQFSLAARYYKEGLKFQNKTTHANYLSLGRLLFTAGQTAEANQLFLRALDTSPDIHKTINKIYSYFKSGKDLHGFTEFSSAIKNKKRYSDHLELTVAKAHMALNQFESAKQTLTRLQKRSHGNAELFYLLAITAKKRKDWDNMELSIQRAAVLEPSNSKYWSLLADSLIYQKKYASAKTYLLKALEHDPENPSYKSKLRKIQSRIH